MFMISVTIGRPVSRLASKELDPVRAQALEVVGRGARQKAPPGASRRRRPHRPRDLENLVARLDRARARDHGEVAAPDLRARDVDHGVVRMEGAVGALEGVGNVLDFGNDRVTEGRSSSRRRVSPTTPTMVFSVPTTTVVLRPWASMSATSCRRLS